MSIAVRSITNRGCLEMNPVQLKEQLSVLANELTGEKNPIKAFDRMAEVLPLDKLQDAIRTEFPQHVDALETAKGMFQEARTYLERTEDKSVATLKSKLSAILDAIIATIESILSAFGIAEMFKPAENDIDASMKGQKVMLLLSLFSLLSATLLPVIGAALVGAIVGGTILAIAVLSLIFPYVKPSASVIPCGANWTKEYSQGRLFAAEGRKKSVDEIAQVLIASKNAHTHPMLIGKSGVGKTETVKALVKAIERGDYPELKGKKVIYFNTADLVNNVEIFSNGNRILSKIKEAIGRHGDQYILIFDEIHVGCQKKEQSAIGDQLKTMIDPGTGRFPFVIGLTTEEDFYRDIYVEHAAFARRFKLINIDNTDPQNTLEILKSVFLREAPKILLENGALLALMEKTAAAYPENAPQPSTALKILSKCIQRTGESQKSELEGRVEQVRGTIAALYSEGAMGQGNSLLPYQGQERRQQIQQLERELEQLERDFVREKEELAQFYQMRDNLALVKQKTFQTAIKVAKNIATMKEKRAFLYLSHFLAPALEGRVRSDANRLGIKTVIDPALIDQMIQEEHEIDLRVQQMIQQGRIQIQQRVEA